ncbi:MAG: A24 family peptidase [Devosia sp.]|nr:A24 family peptidase [Devosia sp.]
MPLVGRQLLADWINEGTHMPLATTCLSIGLVILSMIDLRSLRLPHEITWPMLGIGLAATLALDVAEGVVGISRDERLGSIGHGDRPVQVVGVLQGGNDAPATSVSRFPAASFRGALNLLPASSQRFAASSSKGYKPDRSLSN